MVCERCLELEEEVRQLRDALGFKYDHEPPQMGLTPTQWRIFRALQDSSGGVGKERLARLSVAKPVSDCVDLEANLKVVVCHMRKLLVHYGYEIQPIRGFGYVLVDRNKEAA